MSIKSEKTRQLCYKKALVSGINYDDIVSMTNEIWGDCEEIGYYSKEDFEELADILGDDELAYEFKLMFGTLSADCYNLWNDLKGYDVPEYFNDFFVAVKGGNYGGLGFYGEDYDYYGLDSSETWLAEDKAKKRIERLTKSEIINTATKCFRVFMAFMGVQSRYQDLKTAIDILKDKHSGLLQTIKQINELYEKAAEEHFYGEHTKEFDRLLDALPYDIWVQ